MKIVFIITGLSTGGAEMMLLKVLERLDSDFSPHVISLSTLGEIGQQIESLGISVEALGMRPGRLPGPLEFFRLIRRIKALQPDVVHTWMYHADLIGGCASRLASVKRVAWSIHHSNLSATANKWSTLAVVRACALASHWLPRRILCCSEVARQGHVDFGYAAAKMTVVPNGFDLSLFKPHETARAEIRRELGLGQDTPLVGLIGRLDPQKNHTGFFQAAGLLHKKMPAVHFVLAGMGIDENNELLLQALHKAEVGDVTHLLGLRNDIPRVMAALDVLASSSIGEAFPNVLGEAMACGVPCAVTDVGDSALIVGDTGQVVAAGDMVGLAEAMATLLSPPARGGTRVGDRARARVAEKFEIAQVVKRYEGFYRQLLAPRVSIED